MLKIIKFYHKKTYNIFYSTIILILLLTVLIQNDNIISKAELDDDIDWIVTLHIIEESNKKDDIIFGEAIDASDGLDIYDAPDPGASPMPPYIDAYFKTSFPLPHDKLIREIKHFSYDNLYQEWNFSIIWFPSDYSTPTNVTINWDLQEISDSGYIIYLYRENTLIVNMSQTNIYTYQSSALQPKSFKIVCNRIIQNNPPDAPTKPTGEIEGYHGSSYNYDTSTNDEDNDNLYYFYDWGDDTDSGWLGPYPSGNLCNTNHIWEKPGIYNIKTKAKDEHDQESDWSNPLSVNMLNRVPNTPTNPKPSDDSTKINVNVNPTWTCNDPDLVDILTYDIYFENKTSPQKIISNKSTTSFNPGTLNYDEEYYWKIIAWDNYGLRTIGPLWSFKTESESSDPNGNGDIPDNEDENIPPESDASASEKTGFINSQIKLDGSLSFDSDGYVISWIWDFGDGNTGNGEISTHSYKKIDTYGVTLTVYDNNGANDTDYFLISIGTGNNPPNKPIINGPKIGKINNNYLFKIISTDIDDDVINYHLKWGDGNETVSSFLPNGTSYETEYMWQSAGVYIIEVVADDNKTKSESSTLTILINSKYIKNYGYLIDNNSDGTYDLFFNNNTKSKRIVLNEDINKYLIDINEDGEWDYIYNTLNDTITPYNNQNNIDNSIYLSQSNIFIFLILIFSIVIIISFAIILYKKGYL